MVGAAVISNRNWTVTDGEDERRLSLKDVLEEQWGTRLHWFTGGVDVNFKQRGDALGGLLGKLGWQPNEAFFVGNSETDMQSAINGGLLLLNAVWYEKNMDYGFSFEVPKQVARFIDVFCLRDHHWFFGIEDGNRRAYALAPYGTIAGGTAVKAYSEDFITAVKRELGDGHDFWANYLCTSLYFSGIYADVSYICPYPKHDVGRYPVVLQEPLDTFAKCFRGKYLPDLIHRHTTAPESKSNRGRVDHSHQLSTIHLNRLPRYWSKDQYKQFKSPPLNGSKTVLVVDDIMTNGHSLEAGAAYVRATGAAVISVGLLKTLNTDYRGLKNYRLPGSPYQPNLCTGGCEVNNHIYNSHVIDRDAPRELYEKLRQYKAWEWPVSPAPRGTAASSPPSKL